MPDLLVKKLDPKAVIPKFAHDDDACFDLTAIAREVKGDTAIYSTGLSFGIPKGYCLLVYSRSSHGFRDDMRLSNCVGVIDQGYRGEVKVKLSRDHSNAEWPWVGDRVAQARLQRLTKTTIKEVTELDETERGDGGFGSTGR